MKNLDSIVQDILDMFSPSNPKNKKFDRKRHHANKRLLKLLSKAMSKHPEQRFGQILQNFGFVKTTRPINPKSATEYHVEWHNEFFVEPSDLLKRVKVKFENK